jgi:hypothetical protein
MDGGWIKPSHTACAAKQARLLPVYMIIMACLAVTLVDHEHLPMVIVNTRRLKAPVL